MAQKKSLLSKVNLARKAGVAPVVEGAKVEATQTRGALSMRQLVAKKLAAEKLISAKRPT